MLKLLKKLALENLKHRPVRSLIAVLAIGLEVCLMLTVVGLGRGMVEDSARRTRGIGADIIIRPPGSSYFTLSSAPMPEKLVDFVRQLPHVVMATGSAVYPVSGVTFVAGLNLEEFNKLSGGFVFLKGGPFTGRDDEIIVDEYYAREHNLDVGDTIELMNRQWRVVGIVEPGKLARLVVPLKVLQEITGNIGKISQIYVKVDNPENIPKVLEILKEKLPRYPIYTMQELLSLISVDQVPGLKVFISVVVGVAVVIGFIVVFLSFYTAILERTREIGILKSLGATPYFIVTLVLAETFVLAIAGSIVGILLSFVSRWIIHTTIPASLIQAITPDWWPIATVIAVTGALLGAFYPGWRAARLDPIEALAYE